MPGTASDRTYADDVERGERFRFGENWSRFLAALSEERIADARASLLAMLDVESLRGKSFLDIGSGSGLFSLAARQLGARVRSFDYDPSSVACTQELKRRFFRDDPDWIVEEGSALDAAYLKSLGRFDVVYSWGVLHHTGDMWSALENVNASVAPGGALFIALYNDQGLASKYWTAVKRWYNRYPASRPLLIALHSLYPLLPSMILQKLRRRKYPRGMSPWVDLLDWLGGYPFEVSSPQRIVSFYESRGYEFKRSKTVGRRLGCNEYVFKKMDNG
jgi:2-polyprenyl-6-hydroxyphenyl methylase/3-demethylubiquinone-9 3-methyltransferase